MLAALPRGVAKKIETKGMRAATKMMADETKKRAPVDTGLLRSSFAVRALKRKVGRIGFRVTINTKAKGGRGKAAKAKREGGGFYSTSKAGKKSFYPAVLEYGSTKQTARPFMRPAFDAKKDAAVKQIVDSIKEGVREASSKLKR